MSTRPDHFLPREDELALATDLYQLTMMAAYRTRDLAGESTFELFVRKMPAPRAFLVTAGLEQVLAYLTELRFTQAQVDYLRGLSVFGHVEPEFFEWLENFRFEGDVHAMPEGTLAFPNEPIVRVRAPLAQAQLIETYLLATLNMQTLIASKAARVRIASGERAFIDLGARRAHGFGAAMLATRAAWIAGADGTSNVLAGQRLDIPVLGTAAHAFVMSFEREQDAFALYHRLYPEHCTLLIDTYDTLEGCRRATAVGAGLKGVRLDSGDLGQLAIDCRKILDEAGLTETKIVASGDLNETKIADLIERGCPIDTFGVGTELVTSRDGPALSGVFKLVERRDSGRLIPVMKLSTGKVSWPGAKQVFRVRDAGGVLVRDIIDLAEADAPDAPEGGTVEPLLHPMIESGKLVADEAHWGVEAARARCASELAALPEDLRRLTDYPEPPTSIGPALQTMADTLRASLEAP